MVMSIDANLMQDGIGFRGLGNDSILSKAFCSVLLRVAAVGLLWLSICG